MRKKLFLVLTLLPIELIISAKFPWDYSIQNNQGVANFKNNKFQDASKNFDKAYEYMPNNLIIRYNKANTLYKQKRYGESQSIYLDLLKDKNISAELRQKTYYNLGNTLYRMGQESQHDDFYYKALKNYEKAIDIDSDDKKAKENYEFVKNKLKDKITQQLQNQMNNMNQQPQQNQTNSSNQSAQNNNNSSNNNSNNTSQNNSNNNFESPMTNSAIENFLNNQKRDELSNQNMLNRQYGSGYKANSYQKKDW